MKVYMFVIIVFLTSCQSWDVRLSVENKSNAIIYFAICNDENSEILSCHNYFSKDNEMETYVSKLLPNSKKVIRRTNLDNWDNFINSSELGKMYVYFFLEDTILNHDWGEIIKNRLFVKQLEYDVHDLDSIDWRLVYEVGK